MNIITPGFLIRYFEYLEESIGQGIELTEEVNRAALMRFATVPLTKGEVASLEAEKGVEVPEHLALDIV